MGDYHTLARGTMEIILPEGHIILPKGCIILPEGRCGPEAVQWEIILIPAKGSWRRDRLLGKVQDHEWGWGRAHGQSLTHCLVPAEVEASLIILYLELS